jgi:hypothetical protein
MVIVIEPAPHRQRERERRCTMRTPWGNPDSALEIPFESAHELGVLGRIQALLDDG